MTSSWATTRSPCPQGSTVQPAGTGTARQAVAGDKDLGNPPPSLDERRAANGFDAQDAAQPAPRAIWRASNVKVVCTIVMIIAIASTLLKSGPPTDGSNLN